MIFANKNESTESTSMCFNCCHNNHKFSFLHINSIEISAQLFAEGLENGKNNFPVHAAGVFKAFFLVIKFTHRHTKSRVIPPSITLSYTSTSSSHGQVSNVTYGHLLCSIFNVYFCILLDLSTWYANECRKWNSQRERVDEQHNKNREWRKTVDIAWLNLRLSWTTEWNKKMWT